MNDGVRQYDSVHHASFSKEDLLCQLVRAREWDSTESRGI